MTFHVDRNSKKALFATYPGNKNVQVYLDREDKTRLLPEQAYLVEVVRWANENKWCFVKVVAMVSGIFKELYPKLLAATWEISAKSHQPVTTVQHAVLGEISVKFCHEHKRDELIQYFEVTAIDKGNQHYRFKIGQMEEGFYLVASTVLKQCGTLPA